MEGNTNLNAIGSNYAQQYGHGTTDLIKRVTAGRKISNAAPKQYYVGDMMKTLKRKRKRK